MTGVKGMKKNHTPMLERYDIDDNGCWNYTGGVSAAGYGKIYAGTAHRYFYTHIVGPVDPALQLDHLCRNTLCVNPDHLEPVTGKENQRRRVAVLTHCKNGHPMSDENTATSNRGWRFCRICSREADKRAWRRKMAAKRELAGAAS